MVSFKNARRGKSRACYDHSAAGEIATLAVTNVKGRITEQDCKHKNSRPEFLKLSMMKRALH